METKAHEVLVKNAKRSLENLAKDNTVSLKEVFVGLKEVKEYLDELIWDVEEEIEWDWVDDEVDPDPKYGFDDEGY